MTIQTELQFVVGLTYQYTAHAIAECARFVAIPLILPDDHKFVCSGTDIDGDALTKTVGAFFGLPSTSDTDDGVLIAPLLALQAGSIVLVEGA